MQEKRENHNCFLTLFLLFFVLFCIAASAANISAVSETVSVTVNYSNVTDELQTITVDFCDDWLLQSDDIYNHKLMQASFAMAAAGFRSKIYDLGGMDHDILDFFKKAGFIAPRTEDYHSLTSANTIGTAIAHKKVGDDTIIAVAISGNNYQNEWLSNLTIENDIRPKGFNNAAEKVMQRVEYYIQINQLSGALHLWVSGYSRAAAISNIFAADAVDSHKFAGVHAYTFATPRTTRENDPERYHSIFNIINPEDVVPLIPFPEWGYKRYGIDLYLPSISTDSHYNELFIKANESAKFSTEDIPIFNPRMRRELHTFLDYIAYFVNSVDAYTRGFQNIILRFYQNRNVDEMYHSFLDNIDIEKILNSISERSSVFRHQLYEFYNFLDFNAQAVFTSYLSNTFGSDEDYWNNGLSLQENIAFGHYDKSYRFWLFATDDPEELFTKNPTYLHYAIVGDVDVEVLNEQGDMIQQFDHDGWFVLDTGNPYNPDFHGGLSQVLLYMERIGNRTLIELPGDQVYTVYIRSNKDQRIQVSVVEYAADKLKADVLYIYYDHYDKGEGYPEIIDPAAERLITKDQLETEDHVETADPWDADISYSPSAVMRLENSGVFLTKPLIVIVLLLIILIMLLGLVILLIVKLIRSIVIFISWKVFGKKIPVNEDPLEVPEAKRQMALSSD